MAENKRGVQYGGPWRYGPQPGMTGDPDALAILRYTNPRAAKRYVRLNDIVTETLKFMRKQKRKNG